MIWTELPVIIVLMDLPIFIFDPIYPAIITLLELYKIWLYYRECFKLLHNIFGYSLKSHLFQVIVFPTT